MSKKSNKEFQERINSNKGKPIEKNIELVLDECMVYIDRKNMNIDVRELKLIIEELIHSKEKIDTGGLIGLSKVCDVFYDLRVTRSRIIEDKKELYFSVC